jgi:hypothetical protein
MKFLLVLIAGGLAVSLAGCASTKTPAATAAPQLVLVKKIWSVAPHSAFTDLIRFHDRWFCTFRESSGHLTGEGKIRVIASKNGDDWHSATLLSEKGIDLRDPKLSITPDGRLMLLFGGTIRQGKKEIRREGRVAFSQDGSNWTSPQRTYGTDGWLWRVTWHEGRAYGIVYSVTGQWSARLVDSDDGIHYRTVSDFEIPDRPNEATARFRKNGDCVVLIRREAGDKAAWIGVSAPPYSNWKWSSAGLFIGGPNFIIFDNGPMIASGREIFPQRAAAQTFVGRMDLQSVTPQLMLPGGGNWDCSYPGLVWHNGLLWVSYYSSHEGKASIYLAKVKL